MITGRPSKIELLEKIIQEAEGISYKEYLKKHYGKNDESANTIAREIAAKYSNFEELRKLSSSSVINHLRHYNFAIKKGSYNQKFHDRIEFKK